MLTPITPVLPGLPSLPGPPVPLPTPPTPPPPLPPDPVLPPLAIYRCPKLLEYRFRVGTFGDVFAVAASPPASPPTPSADVSERRSDRLDGANGGDGRLAVPEMAPIPPKPAPAPIGEGGTRELFGDVCAAGRAGRLGSAAPPVESGEGWRRDGEGEWMDGEPEERVDERNG